MNVLYMFLLLLVSVEEYYSKNIFEQCDYFKKIEQSIKEQTNQEISCARNENCIGMNCTGSIKGDHFEAGMTVMCTNPVSFVLFLNFPKFGINGWKKSFSHGDNFDVSEGIKGEFDVTKNNSVFLIGLKGKIMVPGKYFPVLQTPFVIPIVKDIAIPAMSCDDQEMHNSSNISSNSMTMQGSPHEYVKKLTDPPKNIRTQRNCTVNAPVCRLNEICQQINKDLPNGFCICIGDYVRNQDGICIHSPTTSTTATSSAEKQKQGMSLSVLLVCVLVPITVIMLVVAVGYAAIRFRVCHRIRRRFHVQVYEQVLLGQDDEDTDEPLTDPVA